MRSVLVGCLGSLLAAHAAAQNVFATRVVQSDTRGGAGGGIFAPTNALGAPAGSLSVHSLGIGGSLTLGFDVVIVDGPGADFLVSENPFHTTFSESFAEVAFVEVSSDGANFARMPSRYYGPQVDPGAFGTLTVGSYDNLTGQTPNLSAVDPAADPQDVVEAGGDAFDLADLRQHPQVLAGLVDLRNVSQVRLVDARSGIDTDSSGALVRDAGAGSADIDAVTVIQHQANQSATAPAVDLQMQIDGTFTLRIEDPDGWQDLDGASLRTAVFGRPLDPQAVLSGLVLVAADARGFTLRQPVPLPPGLLLRVSVSVKDLAGQRSGVSRSRPL